MNDYKVSSYNTRKTIWLIDLAKKGLTTWQQSLSSRKEWGKKYEDQTSVEQMEK